MAAGILAIATALASCKAEVHVRESPVARVVAPTAGHADQILRVLHEYGRTARQLVGANPRKLQVCLEPVFYFEDRVGKFTACYLGDGRIRLSVNSLGGYGAKIVHEAVHAYADGIAWIERLPHFLKEGMAEYVSLTATGEQEFFERRVPWHLEHADIPDAWWSTNSRFDGETDQESAYYRGYLIFRELGLDAIRDRAMRVERFGPDDLEYLRALKAAR